MSNNTQNKQIDYSKMSYADLKKLEKKLREQITEQKNIQERELEKIFKANPEMKKEWLEMQEIDRELAELAKTRNKSQTSTKQTVEEREQEISIQERLSELRKGLYDTAMEHEEGGNKLSDEAKKEIEELREKMRLLEKKKTEATNTGDTSEKVRALRNKARGITNTDGQEKPIDPKAIEQKVQEMEKKGEKKWVHSGTRKEIVEMLREKAKAEEKTEVKLEEKKEEKIEDKPKPQSN